jgi:ATP-dependent Clp protease protease subunit
MPKSEPIRCFEGTAKPHEPFWSFRNVTEGTEPEMELYGYISEYSWLDDDVTPKMFKEDLERVGAGGPVTIRMNSYGGDVIAASIIRSILLEYPGRVTVQIDGIAASAATVVAMGGDVVKMVDTAYFMIHDPMAVFFLAMLNIEELSQMVDQLKVIKTGIVNAYEAKTGLSREKIGKLMTAETWMDAHEAQDKGFIDAIVTSGAKKVNVQPAAVVNALRNYVNVPADLLAAAGEPDPNQQAADRLRAEVKLLL